MADSRGHKAWLWRLGEAKLIATALQTQKGCQKWEYIACAFSYFQFILTESHLDLTGRRLCFHLKIIKVLMCKVLQVFFLYECKREHVQQWMKLCRTLRCGFTQKANITGSHHLNNSQKCQNPVIITPKTKAFMSESSTDERLVHPCCIRVSQTRQICQSFGYTGKLQKNEWGASLCLEQQLLGGPWLVGPPGGIRRTSTYNTNMTTCWNRVGANSVATQPQPRMHILLLTWKYFFHKAITFHSSQN